VYTLTSEKQVINQFIVPMKYGNEQDFMIAIQELRWIYQTTGKVKTRDLEFISLKYNFPIAFLKKGLKGLVFPDDYRISKSDWFPILYSWKCQERQISDRHLSLQIDFQKSRFDMYRTLILMIGMAYFIVLFSKDYFQLGLWNLFSLIMSFVLFFVALFFKMRYPLLAKKNILEEYSDQLKQRGLERIIKDNNKWIKENHKIVFYAGNILKEKMKSGLELTIFAYHIENKRLIIDDCEDPNIEYMKRISGIEDVIV
jgi:hypothetical protein